jgi:hypothetical protein
MRVSLPDILAVGVRFSWSTKNGNRATVTLFAVRHALKPCLGGVRNSFFDQHE